MILVNYPPPKNGRFRDFFKKIKKILKKHLTSVSQCDIILSVKRQCWNRQTGTFEGRVSLTYGFKSHLPHQFKLRKPPKIRGLRSFIFAKNSLWDLFGTYFSFILRPTKKLILMMQLPATWGLRFLFLLWPALSCRKSVAEPRRLRP